MTASFLPDEEKDGRDAISLIIKKTQERTGRNPDIHVVVSDLTSEDQCQRLVYSHLEYFKDRLDILFALLPEHCVFY